MIKLLKALFGIKDSPVQADDSSPVPVTRDSGFFSTDLTIRERTPLSEREQQLSLSFQKSIRHIAVDTTAADSAIAMDSSIKARFADIPVGIPDAQLGWYAGQGFIGYQLCAMLAQHWLIDKACTVPAEDAVRNGYEVSLEGLEDDEGDKVVQLLDKADKRYKVDKQMEQFVRMGRVFGIRHALFVVVSTDPGYYEKPFNPDGITPGSYRGITQIDPYWITPELDAAAAADPASMHFYEPTYWRIGGKRYHRSHFIIMIDSEVPDILKPTYMFGGVPLPQRIAERVYAAERCANESPQLLLTKRATAIHTDVDKALAQQEKFEKRMLEWIHFRDNYGVKVLGKDETMEQFDTSLSDVDDVIMTEYQLVAAIAKVPSTKLLGTSPKGFNATGEYEESSYHESLESIQTHHLTPLMNRHHLCVMRSEIVPRLGIKPPEVVVSWAALDAPTAKEVAETNLIKAQTGNALTQSGAIDGLDERERIKNDPDSGYAGLADIENGDPPPTPPTEPLVNGEENPAAAVNE